MGRVSQFFFVPRREKKSKKWGSGCQGKAARRSLLSLELLMETTMLTLPSPVAMSVAAAARTEVRLFRRADGGWRAGGVRGGEREEERGEREREKGRTQNFRGCHIA